MDKMLTSYSFDEDVAYGSDRRSYKNIADKIPRKEDNNNYYLNNNVDKMNVNADRSALTISNTEMDKKQKLILMMVQKTCCCLYLFSMIH